MVDGFGTFTGSVDARIQLPAMEEPLPESSMISIFHRHHATIAALTTANVSGNIFVADILCGKPGVPA